MSPTHFSLGPVAQNSGFPLGRRFNVFAAIGWLCLELVVVTLYCFCLPILMSALRISRATRFRLHVMPVLFNSACMRGAPYVPLLLVKVVCIAAVSS